MNDQNINHRFIVSESEINTRLDKYITSHIRLLSRTKIKKLIESGSVSVNNSVQKDSDYKMKFEDEVALQTEQEQTFVLAKHDVDLDIVYEDESILIINKPAGMTVHPGAGNHQDTLVNVLLAHRGDSLSSGAGNDQRPGIVHRLDKDTTGLMIVAKNDSIHYQLSQMLAEREIKRSYLALVYGAFHPLFGTIKTLYGRSKRDPKRMDVMRSSGKEAITHYTTIESFYSGILTLIECSLETGRTHQIRVHTDYKGHPVVGDQTYGRSKNFNLNDLSPEARAAVKSFGRQALHAYKLSFTHPVTGEELAFEAKLPDDFQELVNVLQKGNSLA